MALARRYTVSPELQRFLSGLGSRAIANVVLNTSFTTTTTGTPDPGVLPSNPGTGIRRTVFFSHLDETAATPTEYDVFVQNLNGLAATQLTVPR